MTCSLDYCNSVMMVSEQQHPSVMQGNPTQDSNETDG